MKSQQNNSCEPAYDPMEPELQCMFCGSKATLKGR